jgi:hypothetical protein
MIYRILLDDAKELIIKEADKGAAREIGARVGIDWDPSEIVILKD